MCWPTSCPGQTKFNQQNGHCIRRSSNRSVEVVHPSCRSICHSSEPQTSTVCVSSPRPKCLGHRCSKHNWSGLTAYAMKISLQLLVSTTLLKQSHNYVLHSKPQHLNLSAWCLGVDSSKNKASLWRWQRELLPLKGHQQGPSTSQSGPYLRNGVEKIRWTSQVPL